MKHFLSGFYSQIDEQLTTETDHSDHYCSTVRELSLKHVYYFRANKLKTKSMFQICTLERIKRRIIIQ